MPSESTVRGVIAFAARLDGIDQVALQEGLTVARLHRRIEQRIESDLAGWGLTARQVEIMESLYHNAEGTLSPAALSEEVGLTRSAMTSALDSLEKLGYTVRAPHHSDRRMLTISLTPAGREFMDRLLPERYRKMHRVMSALGREERLALMQTYRRILDVLAAEPPASRPATP